MLKQDQEKEPRSSESNWLKHFNMTPIIDLDCVIGANSPFPVGMRVSYSNEFKKRIAAASISYVLGLRSLDYAYKTYSRDFSFDERSSLGSQINGYLDRIIDESEDEVLKLTNRDVVRLGDQIADMTLLRVSWSLRSAKIIANRGLLFEALCLVRFILEQLAWCYACERLDNEDSILKVNALHSIKPLCDVYPTAGRLYGFLSDFAHWNPRHHHYVFTQDVGSPMAYIQASCRHKAAALCYVLLAVDVHLALIESIYFKSVKEHKIFNKSKRGRFKRRRATRHFVEKVCQTFPEADQLKQALSFFA